MVFGLVLTVVSFVLVVVVVLFIGPVLLDFFQKLPNFCVQIFLTLHTLLAHHHLCYIDVYCVCTVNIKQLRYWFFF